MARRELKICEFNLENLFISLEYQSGEKLDELSEEQWRALALAQLRRRQKPLWKVMGVARALLDMNPDVAMLVEVGGRDSLENFNRHFLGDRYEPVFVEGNSKRSIDLGFLVRRGLPLRATARSNRNTPVEVTALVGSEMVRSVTRFSRDVAELHLEGERGEKQLILMLAHLKSKLTSERDVRGKDARTAEAMALAQLYQRTRVTHPEVPVVVGGDLNAELGSLELELLARTDLTDFHELRGSTAEERASYVHFDHGGRPHPQTLDYLLVSPDLKARVVPERSGTYRYKGFYEIVEPLPETPRERHRMPSDHYPIFLTIAL